MSMTGAGYDQLNSSIAHSKSVFDSQRLARPSVYRHCGRASLCIGTVCLLAEISVFVVKRGLSSAGIGIWTGAPFVIFGAVTMAVPRTRTVCSVNTGFVLGLASMVLSAFGAAACARHISQLADILERRTTPHPNFELSCRLCGYYIMLKEVVQIGLLMLQFAVSAALACFAYADCLCCQPTETELILGGGGAGGGADGGSAPATTATAPIASSSVVTENQNASPSSPPQLHLQQQQQQQQRQQHFASASLTSAAASVSYVGRSAGRSVSQLLQGGSFGPPPMLYDL